MLQYENYHCHTYYSNPLTQPDSCASIADYARVYRERGMKCLIMSEHGNRSNVWQQFQIASRGQDKLVPLAAAQVYFVPNRIIQKDDAGKTINADGRNFHLVLVAKNMEGFYQLNEILSEANETGFYKHARVDFQLLQKLNPSHFVCTTACVGGVLKDETDGQKYVNMLHEIFGRNFFLEIQHHPQTVQVNHNRKVMNLYRKYKYNLIYGTDSHYLTPADSVLRNELLLSAKINNSYEDQFDLSLPTAEKAMELLKNQGIFSRAQIEEAMQNTLMFREFEGVSFTTQKKIPNSRPDLSYDERVKMYKKLVCNSYLDKAGMPSKTERDEIYRQMDAVTDTSTADYFIAMKDIVDKGIQYGGVLTSTGRGSGVSFCSNYALGFTSINRLKCPIKLYPERFTSKDRLASGALPDLDLNMANVPAFQKAGKQILGEYGCLPMIAYGTNKTLSAFKLLSRARNLDFAVSNEIAKQIKNYEMEVKHAIENNADDSDYDVDEDVKIENFVEQKYLKIIEDSKQYKGIVTNISPHPCAHLLLDRDIRRQIGVIRCKAKTGNKQPVYAAYIDGTTADAYGYLKADYLKVDVVKIIDAGFKAIGKETPSVDELIRLVQKDDAVWNLYATGKTIGLNQCEKQKTTERVMRYKPKNIVQLAYFVAAVRPGFKSMLETYISRQEFSYDIPSLDNLLQNSYVKDSFLVFDQQILTILQAAGIPAAEAYATIKAIKKKKADKVAAAGQKFKTGFTKMLKEKESASDKLAQEVCDKVWRIINDAAAYMFCAAHAFSMACDSLYCAYLKAHYPYEFYVTMLKLYDEKGNKTKISQIIKEMKASNIKLKSGSFGQDNRDWLINKENRTISQSLSSVKYMSKNVAKQLFDLSKEQGIDTFSELLYKIQKETCVDTRQLDILINIGYFKNYGGTKKLSKIYDLFTNGNEEYKKVSKNLKQKTALERLSKIKQFEKEIREESPDIIKVLNYELQNIGMCFSKDENAQQKTCLVTSVDDKYGVTVKIYGLARGVQAVRKIKKTIFESNRFNVGDVIRVNKKVTKARYWGNSSIKDEWITDYDVIYKTEA